METKFNIEEYLSEEELKEIAVEEARRAVREALRTTGKMENFLVNLSYAVISKDINEYIPNYKEAIVNGIKERIDKDYHVYQIFKPKDVYDREESLGWRYVQNTIKENKELIEQRVKDCIVNYDMKPFINQKMYETLSELSNSSGDVASCIWNMMHPSDKI